MPNDTIDSNGDGDPAIREEVKRAHAEVSAIVRRTMLTLLGFCLFCWLTLGEPDSSLISGNPTIEIPFANVPVPFGAYLVVAPFLLIVLTVYLHFFLHRLKALDDSYLLRDTEKAQTLFNIEHPVSRLLSDAILYGLTPTTLGALAYKSLALPQWGVPLTVLVILSAAALLTLRLLRGLSNSTAWPAIAGASLIAVLAVAGTAGVLVERDAVRRPLDLFRLRADAAETLPRLWLPDVDLRGAKMAGANLRNAMLSRADFRGADLEGADLSNATLDRADLTGAILAGARLDRADLRFARLDGDDLEGASLDQADLSSAHFTGAILNAASFNGTKVKNAKLEGAQIRGADLSGAFGLTQEQIDGACGDGDTKLPPELEIKTCDLPEFDVGLGRYRQLIADVHPMPISRRYARVRRAIGSGVSRGAG